jgi:hypothetical protein
MTQKTVLKNNLYNVDMFSQESSSCNVCGPEMDPYTFQFSAITRLAIQRRLQTHTNQYYRLELQSHHHNLEILNSGYKLGTQGISINVTVKNKTHSLFSVQNDCKIGTMQILDVYP